MIVHVLTALSYKAHCTTYPFKVFEKQLLENDIEIRYFYRPSAKITECDALVILNEAFVTKGLLLFNEDRNSFLERVRSAVTTILWLDTGDGSGNTWFGVLPYVDLYCKASLLRDKNRYASPLYSERFSSDYYHRQFGIVDERRSDNRSPLNSDDIEKVTVSWNLGLGDLHASTKWRRRIRMLYGEPSYDYRTCKVSVYRQIDVSYRVANHRHLATVSFPRKRVKDLLENSRLSADWKIIAGGKIKYEDYIAEMWGTAVAPSPFGLGEVCYRDFEAYLAGALLFKPDMAHIETWPDYFKPGDTYVPFAWDFSDFIDQLEHFLISRAEREEIAQRGQDYYLRSLSKKGGEEFAAHFNRLIKMAQRKSLGSSKVYN